MPNLASFFEVTSVINKKYQTKLGPITLSLLMFTFASLINKALKLVLDTNSANLDILKNKGMLNYEMVVEYSCCTNMYRILMNDAHNYFKNKILNFQPDHEHGTRAVNLRHINLPFYRLSKCKRSFIYRGLYFWNKLPLALRNVSNLKCFKKTLKQYIFERL